MGERILNGWKEISCHIGRGVRTAQRWESLGMPVHRPASKDRSAVVAFADELDRWITRNGPVEEEDTLARVRENVSSLSRHASELAARTGSLQMQIRRSIEISRRRRNPITARASLSAAPGRGAMLLFRSRSGATNE
jgi:hypothetical protein